MSDYIVVDQRIGTPAITATQSSPMCSLGCETPAFDRAAATSLGGAAGLFVYCRGSNVASAGQFVQIQDGSAVLLAAANSALAFPIGVACAVLGATSVYGWVQIQGRVDYARGTNTGLTVGIPQYICAGTAGIVVSNSVAGNRIQGIEVPFTQTVTSLSAGGYVYDLQRPFVAGVTALL